MTDSKKLEGVCIQGVGRLGGSRAMRVAREEYPSTPGQQSQIRSGQPARRHMVRTCVKYDATVVPRVIEGVNARWAAK